MNEEMLEEALNTFTDSPNDPSGIYFILNLKNS